MRRAVAAPTVTWLWTAARDGQGPPGRPCPSCDAPTVEVGVNGGPRIDVCTRCHFLWFDPSELESLPAQPAPPLQAEMPDDAREIMARAAAQQIAEQHGGPGFGAAGPDEMWKFLPAIFGMPVEYETSPPARLPWMTWIVAALATGVSVAGFFNMENALRQYALVPAEPWRHGGLTLLTSFLLHGNLFHLISNMYFLLVFGDNVEDVLGKGAYLGLLLAAALAGGLLHIAFDPRPAIPVIGASGGISGLILYYALTFPRARVGVLLRIVFSFRWVSMPAYAYVGFWVLLQIIGAFRQLAGMTNVSALGHLGGASVGLVAWLLTRRR